MTSDYFVRVIAVRESDFTIEFPTGRRASVKNSDVRADFLPMKVGDEIPFTIKDDLISVRFQHRRHA